MKTYKIQNYRNGEKKLMPMKSVFTDMSSIQMPYWTKKIGDIKKKVIPKVAML